MKVKMSKLIVNISMEYQSYIKETNTLSPIKQLQATLIGC